MTLDLPAFHLKTNEKLESLKISEQEVCDILSSLNVNKASGPNFISYRLLKSVARAVSKPLTTLFNRLIFSRNVGSFRTLFLSPKREMRMIHLTTDLYHYLIHLVR